MSAPAITYFCQNGHLVMEIEHGSYLIDEARVNLQCEQCLSRNIRGVIEWHEPDYWHDDKFRPPGDHPQVSHIPLRFEPPRKPIEIPIYDVSRLFA